MHEKFAVSRLTSEIRERIEVEVAIEFPLTILLNGQELVTLLCSPKNLEELAVGFLSSEGLLKRKGEIKKILADYERGVIRVETEEDTTLARDIVFKRFITSGCGRGASLYSAVDATSQRVNSQMMVSVDEVFALVNQFQHSSKFYLVTHGVHGAALCNNNSILLLSEDLARHNTIDRIFGRCLLEDIPIDNHLVITSGRVSSEMVHKVAKRGIPIIVSIAVPTNLGVRIAEDLGITLIGSVRGKKMNIYTNDWRVSS